MGQQPFHMPQMLHKPRNKGVLAPLGGRGQQGTSLLAIRAEPGQQGISLRAIRERLMCLDTLLISPKGPVT